MMLKLPNFSQSIVVSSQKLDKQTVVNSECHIFYSILLIISPSQPIF